MIKDLFTRFWTWLRNQTDLDEKLVETFDETKRRYNRVKEEIADIKESASDVINQVNDVAKAVSGSKRKGRKPSTHKITKSALRVMKKQDLIKLAKTEFKVVLDSKLSKSNLVNRVYELYYKK